MTSDGSNTIFSNIKTSKGLKHHFFEHGTDSNMFIWKQLNFEQALNIYYTYDLENLPYIESILIFFKLWNEINKILEILI